MYGAGFWEIVDENIAKQIKEMADKIKASIINKPPEKKESAEEDMPDEVLDEQIATLQSEKAKRNLAKAKLTGKVHQVSVKSGKKAAEDADENKTSEVPGKKMEHGNKGRSKIVTTEK
jgi:hypothetical protein